jgi:hypothetical protein
MLLPRYGYLSQEAYRRTAISFAPKGASITGPNLCLIDCGEVKWTDLATEFCGNGDEHPGSMTRRIS